MKSSVYFTPVSQSDSPSAIQAKLRRILDRSALLDCASPGANAVIKMHFGEEGNTGFVDPGHVRVIVEALSPRTASVVISDTNTLYRGRRTNVADHEALAHDHGFTPETTGGSIVIGDETDKANCLEVDVNGQYIKRAKILRMYKDAGVLVGLAHFKGHIMTGFGGALKNIGMGCATREGKMAQHSDVSPVIHWQNCIGCGACATSCPVDAITVVEGKAVIDKNLCIGCATCIAVCNYGAIDVVWEAGGDVLQEKMIEYTKAVINGKREVVFINFALKITQECDCLAKDDPRISPDVGVLASADPVSLDQATYDLIIKKANNRDVFREAHPQRDGLRQLAYAEKLGLGSRLYELMEV